MKSILTGYRQPLGCSDTATFMPNFFSFIMRTNGRKTKRKELIQVRKFNKLFWLIDTPAAINNCGEFEKLYHEMYPLEVGLKHGIRTDTDNCF